MILFDAKKLWVEGGYDLNNQFESSIVRIKKYGDEKKVDQQIVDALLIDLFMELRDNPTKYRTEGNVCFCGCGMTNSATNIIHTMFKLIDETAMSIQEALNKNIVDSLNKKIVEYMEGENKKYLEEFGPKEYKWYNMPTFKKWLRIK